jgi:hypothetical protein
MLRIIEVECCKECPFSAWVNSYISMTSVAFKYACTRNGKRIMIDDVSTIPTWCSLAPGGNQNEQESSDESKG